MNTIIECSRANASKFTSNSSWENIFSKPIIINQGDRVELHTAIIDTSDFNSSFITLDEDVNLQLSFGYYVINFTKSERDMFKYHKETNTLAKIDPFQVDFKAYICRSDSLIGGLGDIKKGYITKTLKKGIYSPDLLAETITKLFTEVALDWSDIEQGLPYNNPFVLPDFGSEFVYTEETASTDDATIDFFLITTPQMIGANQVSLVFNKDYSGKFEFEYLHSPYSYDNKPSIHIKMGTAFQEETFRAANAFSGVFLTQLEPKAFWEDVLGFETGSILYTVDETTFKVSHGIIDEQGRKTTGGLFSISNWVTPVTKGENTMKITDDIVNAILPTETIGIRAERIYEPNVGGGFYIIKCNNFTNDYREDDERRIDVNGIVSRQYVNNNFTTGFAESGITYENTGEPFVLSSMAIEILDGTKKVPVESLGSNSSIFFRIIRK